MKDFFKSPWVQWVITIVFAAGVVVATTEGRFVNTKTEMEHLKGQMSEVRAECRTNSEDVAGIKKSIENIDKNIQRLLDLHVTR